MIRARAGAAVHAARLEIQMKRAEQREREALARAGALLAASERVPASGELQALAAEARRLRLELEAHSGAVARSLEADRADYPAVAAWVRPLVVLRGLSARAVLRHQVARCERELRPLHERLAAAALAEPGATGASVPGTLAEAIRGARAERDTALAERTRRLAAFEGKALPPWLGWVADEGKALGRSLVKQLQGQFLPRASALAGLAAGWWVAHTYTDSRPRSLLRSIGIGHGGTHVVSGDTYRALSFWLPIAAAAVCAYLGDRVARWVRGRYQPSGGADGEASAAGADPR
ncbi:MAG TPA: hypothetical protein VEU27_06265 [Gemmatimonadales bacterium]|jgi:hypothetical protein|nr:hypothetical protein [Gemmatimonadales bacterium]